MIVRIAGAMGFDVRKLVPFGRGTARGHGTIARRAVRRSRPSCRMAGGQGLEPKMSPFDPMAILDEIQRLVPGYDVSRMNMLAGNDQHTTLSGSGPGALHNPELIVPAQRCSVSLRAHWAVIPAL